MAKEKLERKIITGEAHPLSVNELGIRQPGADFLKILKFKFLELSPQSKDWLRI